MDRPPFWDDEKYWYLHTIPDAAFAVLTRPFLPEHPGRPRCTYSRFRDDAAMDRWITEHAPKDWVVTHRFTVADVNAYHDFLADQAAA